MLAFDVARKVCGERLAWKGRSHDTAGDGELRGAGIEEWQGDMRETNIEEKRVQETRDGGTAR